MRSVGLKVLKNKLSEYVRLASQGEVVLVTDRDRVVAELTPPAPGRGVAVGDALLANAVREGWIRPAALQQNGAPARKPVAPLAVLMRELEADRRDR